MSLWVFGLAIMIYFIIELFSFILFCETILLYKIWLTSIYLMNRLSTLEDLARAKIKKLTQGMVEQSKAMAAAKTEDEKDVIVGLPSFLCSDC